MKPDPQPPNSGAARVPIFPSAIGMLFALFSLRASSVGWILCCAISVVASIFACIYCFTTISRVNRPRLSVALTSVALIVSVALLIASYHHNASVSGL